MNFIDQFLWVIFPYLMLATFVVGHIYRYNTDQIGWTSKSSQFLEKDTLKWGSMLFHIGFAMVFGGHVIGLLVPKAVTAALGIDDHTYHLAAVYGGGAAGVVTLAGSLILLLRRINVKRIRAASSFTDYLVAVMLFALIAIGVLMTFGSAVSHSDFDYRTTIGPWLRGLLTLQPDLTLMAQVPLLFKLHVLLGFGVFGLWPFTRLVHVWSLPLEYFNRSQILYRSRNIDVTLG